MSQYATENPKNIVPFDSSSRAREPDALDLDRSGQAIIALLQEAADAARANEDRAMSVAQKLSGQVQTVEDRAKQLEADVRYHQDRADRAEEWLLRVYKEIEDRFFDQNIPLSRGKTAQR